jgi:hypothetical protein
MGPTTGYDNASPTWGKDEIMLTGHSSLPVMLHDYEMAFSRRFLSPISAWAYPGAPSVPLSNL